MGDAGAEAGAAMCVGAAGRRDIMRQEMFWNPVLISTDLDRVLATFLCRFLSIYGHFQPFPSNFWLVPDHEVVFLGIFTQNLAYF